MEIGLISDIHANLPALTAVLDELEERGVEDILCAGDYVGYYPFPNEVLDIVSGRNIKGIRGNHDEAVVSGIPTGYSDSAIETLDWTQENVTDRSVEELKNHPIERVEKYGPISVHLVHGSPQYPLSEYIYPEDVDQRFLRESPVRDPDFLVLGHTHEQFMTEVENTVVVNPGSVGQPRDGDSSAAYAVLDTEYSAVTLYRTKYEVSATKNRIEKEGLPNNLAKRLEEGR